MDVSYIGCRGEGSATHDFVREVAYRRWRAGLDGCDPDNNWNLAKQNVAAWSSGLGIVDEDELLDRVRNQTIYPRWTWESAVRTLADSVRIGQDPVVCHHGCQCEGNPPDDPQMEMLYGR